VPIPIDQPAPVIANPATARADAILLPAGAWDVAPVEIASAGYGWVRFYFAYQRGAQATAGAITFQYEISPYYADLSEDTDWITQTIYAPAPMTPCEDVCSEVQNETIRYCAVGSGVETFCSPPIHLAGCVERIRVPCQESGDTDNPGSAQVIAVFYSEA
jgi:hypothetical protein